MNECESCACEVDIPVHATPEYRRALWLVAILNLAMGVAESGFGFLASSQALKADALDFVGDGLITSLGLVALNWGGRQRAHTALAQGVFLALMGLGVLAATLYRTFAAHVPEADIMGILGIIALVINIACAAILLRFRNGDANVRAVWLFSRNDAIGNVAVILASIAVGITATPWPDLLVAAAIAGLFIHSASGIVRESLVELQIPN